MTGLEKIQEKILAQSKLNCENIISAANEEAKNILIEARQKAQQAYNEIISNATELSFKKNNLAKSGAEAISRNRYLEVRNAIINDIISAAYEEIDKMTDDEYFDLLRNLCVKNISPGEYIMFFNSRDLNRLPEDFEDSLNSVIYKTSAVFITKEEPINIPHGFILKGDGVEINCTLRAVFDANMDRLRDSLNAKLFS